MTQITYLTDVCIITAVVSTATKQADSMLLAARELGAKGALAYHARGHGVRERLGVLGVAVETDKDVVQVLVSNEQKDMVFEAMFKAGQLDRAGAGYIYMTPIEKLATHVPESIRDRLKEEGKLRRAI